MCKEASASTNKTHFRIEKSEKACIGPCLLVLHSLSLIGDKDYERLSFITRNQCLKHKFAFSDWYGQCVEVGGLRSIEASAQITKTQIRLKYALKRVFRLCLLVPHGFSSKSDRNYKR